MVGIISSKGRRPCRPRVAAPPLLGFKIDENLDHIFDIVFMSIFPGFGANLVQLGTQLGVKIDQKSFQDASKSEANLHLIFDAFFH